MRKFYILYFFAGLAIFSSAILSCSKDDDSADPRPDFDRSELVANVGDNVIIPAYQNLSTSINELNDAVLAFDANTNATTLVDAQSKFRDAYLSWQHCAPFSFGPADQALLGKNINIFPANTNKINANIASGSYNLDQLSNLDAKGFPAVDYLLFGASDNDELLTLYITDQHAGQRMAYLVALSANMKKLSTDVLNAWIASGQNYIATFKGATGTDIGSATGMVINGIDYDLDLLKNFKVAIPVGVMPGAGSTSGEPLPEKVEAYYSGMSAALLKEEVTAIQNIYLGNGTAGDGIGLDDYLIKNNVAYRDGLLNDAIKNQFTAVLAKLNAVSDPLSGAIDSNPEAVKALYTELQKLLVLLKTDMPSSLGILITYEDNDGD